DCTGGVGANDDLRERLASDLVAFRVDASRPLAVDIREVHRIRTDLGVASADLTADSSPREHIEQSERVHLDLEESDARIRDVAEELARQGRWCDMSLRQSSGGLDVDVSGRTQKCDS
ncbi:MAG: hypothetical protein ACK55I_14005, partial [bacterium]